MPTIPDAADVLSCPRCLTNLVSLRVGAVAVRGCPTCAGVWLDPDTNRRMAEGFDEEAVAAVRAHSSKAKVKVDESVGNLSCPVCRKALRRHRIDNAWLDVDICDDHGTWYDKGEVERVTQALNAPVATGDWRSVADPDEHEPYRPNYHGVVSAMRRLQEGIAERAREERAKSYDSEWG